MLLQPLHDLLDARGVVGLRALEQALARGERRDAPCRGSLRGADRARDLVGDRAEVLALVDAGDDDVRLLLQPTLVERVRSPCRPGSRRPRSPGSRSPSVVSVAVSVPGVVCDAGAGLVLRRRDHGDLHAGELRAAPRRARRCRRPRRRRRSSRGSGTASGSSSRLRSLARRRGRASWRAAGRRSRRVDGAWLVPPGWCRLRSSRARRVSRSVGDPGRRRSPGRRAAPRRCARRPSVPSSGPAARRPSP